MIRRVVLNGRERYSDLERGARYAATARLELHAAQVSLGDDELSRADLGRALQQLSEALRLCGELEQSRMFKQRALEIWRGLDRARACFLVRLQLALVESELQQQPVGFAPLRAEMDADQRFEVYREVLGDYEARAQLMSESLES